MQYSVDPYMGAKMKRIWLKNYSNVGRIDDFNQKSARLFSNGSPVPFTEPVFIFQMMLFKISGNKGLPF